MTVNLRVGAAVLLAVALAGCGSEGGIPASVGAASTAPTASTAPVSGPVAGEEAEEPAGDDAEKKGPPASPSLPPGDPGLDAPSVPDPGTAGATPHEHGKDAEHVRRTVPAAAMLTADTVEMVVGGRWREHDGGADECVRPAGELGSRSRSYGGTDTGLVVETVATYADGKRADAAVGKLAKVAQRCGWGSVRDPRLGSASVTAVNGARSLTAVSAEGVVVLLVGTGSVTRGWQWDSLVDMALGSSCPAAPDGCH